MVETVYGAEVTAGAPVKRITWSAIFAGAVVALVVQLVLGVLGLGIGFGIVSQNADPSMGTEFAVGSAIYWVIAALISLFAGGWVAGRLSGQRSKTDASLHGFLTWGVATLVTILFLGSAVGSFIGGGLRMIGQGAQTAAQTVQSGSSAGMQPEQIEQTLRQMGVSQAEIDQVKQRMQQRVESTAQNVQQNVEQVQQAGQQPGMQPVERDIQQTTEQVAGGIAQAAWWTFAALVLGALASWFGGALGRRKAENVTTVRPATV